MIKIIDNKKVEMTNDEFALYQEICKSYDRANSKGSDLFHNLFESDDSGTIIFLRPPSTRHTSMEVFLFVVILMHHQQIRLSTAKIDDLCKEFRTKMNDYFSKLDNDEKK